MVVKVTTWVMEEGEEDRCMDLHMEEEGEEEEEEEVVAAALGGQGSGLVTCLLHNNTFHKGRECEYRVWRGR